MSPIIQKIADDLYAARQNLTPIDHIRHQLPGGDLASAYAISEINTQRRVQEQKLRRVGRKVGLTNPMVQRKAGVDQPDYGIILEDMVFPGGVVRPRSAFIKPKIEAELAFVLKEDLLSSDLAAVEAAIDYVVPAIELVDCRYHNYGMSILDTVADNAACEGVVTGAVRKPYGEIDLNEVEMILYRGDEEVTRGIGRNVLAGPVNAIQWLAETSLRINKPLRAGEILLSGSIGMIVDWETDVPYTAVYSHGFGSVSATLDSKDLHHA
ncbi:fumarylacetoacetate hydrolase family protein [Arthrobacter sp. zg-Y859]|uniref:Fumarylacetoacetate hydrolase family protein n=1 Tax=Arthrobacter jinronghuae TaxID=2964609 RepID=A0ABT1NMD9_9MICC|nr:fumarylacetoacetate hydrolase family protein [Arthrobacter jinronghuae]MCQ1948888.1 fumarylacetoacetate hydrolase family protein [Arthrobacter jinronghuae]UWX78307.1 fumarylacetoacetate hydrolase family protein [Arthrobacter jinronghuae]